MLNYHAAHDIGHALQNYHLVGCTSFSTWTGNPTDLIVARNFDFSMGEAFAENKIICFYNPEEGIPFAMVTWSDFIGCVSGMNIKGLSVTINAGENEVPTSIGTPISLIAREIVQFAGNIEEAYRIAGSRKAFVSESFLVSSASDGYSAIIEKTPDTTILILPDQQSIVCSNHFLSDYLKRSDSSEVMPASKYRYDRLSSLLAETDSMNPYKAAEILRNQKGNQESDIGMGNEKALNQLIAHHAVIFKPSERKIWVSTPPYQLGNFLCYDLDSVFGKFSKLDKPAVINIPDESIEEDAFLNSKDYMYFTTWKQMQQQLKKAIDNSDILVENFLDEFIGLNPQYFYSYELCGNYCVSIGDEKEALKFYKQALEKELSNPNDLDRLKSYISKLEP